MFEYARRRRRLDERLREEAIDLLFLPLSSDLEYLTGLERPLPSFGQTAQAHDWVSGPSSGRGEIRSSSSRAWSRSKTSPTYPVSSSWLVSVTTLSPRSPLSWAAPASASATGHAPRRSSCCSASIRARSSPHRLRPPGSRLRVPFPRPWVRLGSCARLRGREPTPGAALAAEQVFQFAIQRSRDEHVFRVLPD
jgi:hypothetical protein